MPFLAIWPIKLTLICQLLARFVTVDEELLQKTNNTRVVTKLVKKGGQAKELSEKILHHAAAATKRKQSNGKSTSKENSPMKSLMDAVNDFKTEVAGSKRTREGDGSAQPAKRMVVTANPKTATATNGPTKRTGPGAQPGKSTIAARPKANIIAPNPSSLFGSLSSASKKPGTTNAERKAAAAAAKPAYVNCP